MKKNLMKFREKVEQVFNNYNTANCCLSCNSCCKTPCFIMPEEKEDISELTELFCVNGKLLFINSSQNGVPICKFYENKRCKIYKKRPLVCIIYPFAFTIKRGRLVLNIDKDCLITKQLEKNNKFNVFVKDFLKILDETMLRKLYVFAMNINELTVMEKGGYLSPIKVFDRIRE